MNGEKAIYESQAQQYDRLVSREDYQNNLWRALVEITDFEDANVLELGAGTGRLTRLLAPSVRRIYAFDLSLAMLSVAAARLSACGQNNWDWAAADHRHLPVRSQAADLVLSGWSICYLVTWGDESWRGEVSLALSEMQRVLKPGGKIILLETLGTGFETPHPPEHLLGYYDFLAQSGFQSTWIRTDYRFSSLAEAVELAGFFFGEELRRKVAEQGWIVLPECTGIWWRAKLPD